MRIFSYDRTSVDDRNKISNDAQYLEICREMSTNYGFEPKRFSDRGFSGGNGKRPGLQLLEQSICESKEDGVLYVWRYDRLFRNAKLALEFMLLCNNQNVEVISISEPILSSTASFAMKKMFVSLLFINAELQRSSISENIMSGLAYKRSQRKYMSSAVPFGYCLKEGTLVQELVEVEAVKRLFELYLSQDGYGYQRLANQLNIEGFSFKGGKFKKHTISMILRNPVYYGQVKGGTFGEYQGDFDPIITKSDFDKAQEIRQSRQKKKLALQRTYPLRKKLKCPACGRRLSCRWSKSPSGKNLRYYYYCSNRDCEGLTIRAEKIEEEVLTLLRKFASHQTIYAAIQRELLSQVRSGNKSQQKKQKNFEAERKVVLQKFEDGVITLEEMKVELALLKREEQPEAMEYNNKEEIIKDLQQILKLTKAPIKELFFEQVELVQVNRSKEITGLYLQGIKQNIVERM